MFNRCSSALVATAIFVLLWSSGAIASEIGLRYGSPFALLTLRYATAFLVLAAVAGAHGTLLPKAGTRLRNVLIGFLIAGLYSTFYLLALDNGVTPGSLATLLGVQPILTMFLTERRVTVSRLLGLYCALGGMALVASDGLASMKFDALGLSFAGLSLAGITAGSLLQKQETQAPWIVLPTQYAAGLLLALAFLPLGEFRASLELGFVLPVLWLGLVISVGATFLLYRLIAEGNLVNVTSLFYLVPGVTAAMDWALLGNRISALMLAGLGLIVVGLLIVFRQKAP